MKDHEESPPKFEFKSEDLEIETQGSSVRRGLVFICVNGDPFIITVHEAKELVDVINQAIAQADDRILVYPWGGIKV